METQTKIEGKTHELAPEPPDDETRAKAIAWVNERRQLRRLEPIAEFPEPLYDQPPYLGNPLAQALGCKVFRNVVPPLTWGTTQDYKVAEALGLKNTYPDCCFEGHLPGFLWHFAGV